MRRRNLTWTVGGSALLVSGIIVLLGNAVLSPVLSPALTVIYNVFWAGGVSALAIGRTRSESVVARRPLGVAALLVVAWWGVIMEILTLALFASPPADSADATASPVLTTVAYLNILIPLAAGIIGVVQIARARVVPSPWRWAPLWVLAFTVVVGLSTQVVVSSSSFVSPQSIDLIRLLSTLPLLCSTIGLGLLALILAERSRPSSVQVFRSPGS